MARDDLLPWGWTWARLEELARRAAYSSRATVLPWEQLLEAAMDGAVMALAEADIAPPSERDLFLAASASISAEAADTISRHGLRRNGTTRGARHSAYWGPGNRPPDPFADLDDHLALRQIWPRLAERDRETLSELAYWLDHRAAAESLGYPWGTWRSVIARTRNRAKALWFSPDPPAPHYMHDSGSLAGSRTDPGRRLTNRRKQRRRKGMQAHG